MVEVVLKLVDDSTVAVDMDAKPNNSIDRCDERVIGRSFRESIVACVCFS